jgi:hypothetical protein
MRYFFLRRPPSAVATLRAGGLRRCRVGGARVRPRREDRLSAQRATDGAGDERQVDVQTRDEE